MQPSNQKGLGDRLFSEPVSTGGADRRPGWRDRWDGGSWRSGWRWGGGGVTGCGLPPPNARALRGHLPRASCLSFLWQELEPATRRGRSRECAARLGMCAAHAWGALRGSWVCSPEWGPSQSRSTVGNPIHKALTLAASLVAASLVAARLRGAIGDPPGPPVPAIHFPRVPASCSGFHAPPGRSDLRQGLEFEDKTSCFG